jgi:hypothetical protein
VILAAACHQLGLAGDVPASYPYSGYLLACFGWQAALAYFFMAMAIGGVSRTPLPVAIGMLLPMPLATLIEVFIDRTGHNLLPLEIILYWAPAFALALLAAYLGRQIRLKTGHVAV